MVSAYDIGVRLLKYTFYTFFTYLLGFAGVLILYSIEFDFFGGLMDLLVLILVFNLILFLYSHRNMDAFDDGRLEFICAVLPVFITPLGGYIVGGILMTLVGPPLEARRQLE